MLGAGWVSFLRFFLLAFSGSSGRSSPQGLWPSTPPASPSPHSAPSLSPPPPPRAGPPSSPAASPLWGEGLRRGGQTKGPRQTRGHPTAALPTRPPPPGGECSSPFLSPARGPGSSPLFAPATPAPSFPGLVRANLFAAGAEPPGVCNTKECTGHGSGRRSEDGRQLSWFLGWGTGS